MMYMTLPLPVGTTSQGCDFISYIK